MLYPDAYKHLANNQAIQNSELNTKKTLTYLAIPVTGRP